MHFDKRLPDVAYSGGSMQYEPIESKALQELTSATSLLNKALLNKDIPLFKKAFGLAEKAVGFLPDSAAGQYILGMAKLKGWGDKDYAFEKYKVLSTSALKFAPELAQILKEELETGDVG
jgi:hypothetical protein